MSKMFKILVGSLAAPRRNKKSKITLEGQIAYMFKVFQIRGGWIIETHRTDEGNWGENIIQQFVPEEESHRLAEYMTANMAEIAIAKALKK